MIELLERHGASGPHAVTVLLSEAAAGVQGRKDRGVAELSWREFATFAGIERGQVQTRLRELAAEPFTLIEIDAETDLGFRARFPRWAEWDKMPKDPSAAERSRAYRERKRVAPGEFDPVTGRLAVTERDDHAQDSDRDSTAHVEGKE